MAWLDRLVVAALQACCRRVWGFAPAVLPHMVEHFGPIRASSWFAVNMPRYLYSLRRFGGIRAHLACIVVSLYNGSHYCAHGHGYALELLYLRDHGRLFPLDVRTLRGWPDHDPRTLGRRLREVLQAAGMPGEALWVDTTLGLLAGDLPVDEDEVLLAHLVTMVSEMNAVALAAGIAPDGAQNPVNKDAEVKARHAELRAQLSL